MVKFAKLYDTHVKEPKMDYLDLQRKILTEETRAQLLGQSRNAGPYVDQSRGVNRDQRKKYSQIKKDPKAYSTLNMDQFFKQDILELKVPVVGETNEYLVTLRFSGVCAELQRLLKLNKYKYEYKVVLQALRNIFGRADIYTSCTCPDHLYTFKHWNILRGVDTAGTAGDPGPGKGIRNPKDQDGRGCKHCLLVLDNTEWLLQVAKVIDQYIRDMETKLSTAFLSVIFPKLYGVPADQMVDKNLINTSKYLENSNGLIDAISAYSDQEKQKAEQPEETIEVSEGPDAEAVGDTNK